jgi:hypothetical protein
MAAENWRERLTEADWKNWQAAYDRWVERDARAWAVSPNNRNIAQGLYPHQQRVDHSKRGGVSPLGGQAAEGERK